ncbi:TetR/AcrR family transcriptional regulator [Rhodovulum sp. DZ06]|uniref:TetR/AcrR family transcriptional regulator n=1 Tax=Rhodovulum sp. DZ06 TaxID=3425126 RepID=UPI003D34930A
MSRVSDPPATAAESGRFQRKRAEIVRAASGLIADRGLQGLTLAAAAEAAGLKTTSVTYYFRRKDLLAEAALDAALDRQHLVIEAAGAEATPRARLGAMVSGVLAAHAEARRGGEGLAPILSDIRSMEEDAAARLSARYRGLVNRVADFFGPRRAPAERAVDLARAQALMECMHWLRAWLPRYALSDFPRVEARLLALFETGFAPAGAAWDPAPLDVGPEGAGAGAEIDRDAYLRAAAQLLNERGYRGASVERIAARLNVSKGSFYHHLDAKDDLVMDCFAQSYERLSRAQRLAIDAPAPDFQARLASCINALLQVQFSGAHPLLRTTAMQALPSELRPKVVARSDRAALRFAGMMIDGIAEGSVRPVDPLIASQCVMALLNGAVDFRVWADHRESPAEAARLFAAPLRTGFFTDPPGG